MRILFSGAAAPRSAFLPIAPLLHPWWRWCVPWASRSGAPGCGGGGVRGKPRPSQRNDSHRRVFLNTWYAVLLSIYLGLCAVASHEGVQFWLWLMTLRVWHSTDTDDAVAVHQINRVRHGYSCFGAEFCVYRHGGEGESRARGGSGSVRGSEGSASCSSWVVGASTIGVDRRFNLVKPDLLPSCLVQP